jgi:ribosomal protein L34
LTKQAKIYIIKWSKASGGAIMKRTYQPNNHRRSKKMGFLARIKSGVVARRRRKGRKVLSR